MSEHSSVSKPRAMGRRAAVGLGGGVILIGMSVFGLWKAYWWAGMAIAFSLIVILADSTARRLSPKARPRFERLLTFGFPILLLLAWELLVGVGILSARWFPPPSRIAQALWDITVTYDRFNQTSLLGRPWLIPQEWRAAGWPGVAALLDESHVLATLSRVFAGFLIGALPGIGVGMVMGMNRTVRLMLDTTMSAIYVLPKIAIFPIMMLIFPNPFGEGPKIAVVAISAFFLVAINTMAGVRDIDPVFIQAGRNYGANRWQLFRHVILPGAMPVIFAGLRLALGTALIVIVAIEFVRAKKGVGFLAFYYWEILVTEKMYAGLFVVMALGIILTYGLQWLERRIMPWQAGK
ncbi:MAG: ABC transporter permease [Caldilineaceae bacterium]|nr:ABC transporter permease [Caldilineaceae bacterium]MBP8106183.1 ABC transporter permease [Caldilineaceae bacterium]MBP8125666.1 ABC transporter permease [Caldilineaceae bacterium]MBP9075129.1 ABC transporter permease [Caldilineaceae bacterium]